MSQSLTARGRYLFLSIAYALLWLAAALFAVMLSFGAQRGGISQFNAFLAVLLGPWSQTLPPNPHPMSVWTLEFTVFADCLAVVLAYSVFGSYFAKTGGLRYTSTGVSILALVAWVLSGLAKVVLEMS